MAINFLLKRSNTASKRPTAAQLDIGELSLNYEQNTCGVYFEDSNGDVRKVGPVEVSASAPNATPAGSSGNSLGELWYDTGSSNLKIWTGASFVSATSSVAAGGSDTQIQFNSTGSLAGDADFVFSSGNLGLGESSPTAAKMVIRDTESFLFNALRLYNYHGDASNQGSVDIVFGVRNSVGNIARSQIVSKETSSDSNRTLLQFAVSNNNSGNPAVALSIQDEALSGQPVVYIGNDVFSSSPADSRISATRASGTDIAGADLYISAGESTGTGAGGELYFQTTGSSASSSTRNTRNTVLKISNSGHLVPGADSTHDIGLTGTRWRAIYADNVYTGDLHMKNERGDYTLIEEEDALTIRNNKTGKVYNIMMTEREV